MATHAHEHGCVIITKDEDFSQRAQADPAGPIVIWLRVGNTSNAMLRASLLPQMPVAVRLIGQGYRLLEVR